MKTPFTLIFLLYVGGVSIFFCLLGILGGVIWDIPLRDVCIMLLWSILYELVVAIISYFKFKHV